MNCHDLISIVILSLDRLEKTRKCIAGIRMFTAEPYEIILVDNGSQSAETKARLLELQSEDLSLILLRKNIGVAAGRQLGLEKSQGSYIVFLDNDMEVTPGWSTALISRLKKEKEAGVACCKVILNGRVQLSGRQIVERNGKRFVDYGYDYLPPTHPWVVKEHPCDIVHGGATMFKREVFEKVAYDLRYFLGCEDLDLMLQIKKQGWLLVNCPEATVHHNRDYMTEYDKKIRARLDVISESKKRLFEKWRVVV